MTEKMKPSGIAWIGDIPYDWDCKRYRFCGNVQYGYPFNSDYFTTEEAGFPLIRIRDITSGEIATYYEGSYPEEYIVKNGDVLVGMDGDFNVRVWKNCDALLNQRCCRVFDSQQISKRFMSYYLPHYLKVINDLTWSTTVKHLLADDINNIYVSYPSISEQQAIADFLDVQCAKIDGVISDIEKQIETLQKYKKSLITEAVTKGLDRSVPMKDSGIDWIGTIPTHWDTNRLRYVASVKTGPFGTQLSADEYVDEGVPIINVKNIGYGSILAEDLDCVPESVADRLSVHRLKLDDIVFGRKGAVDKHAIITDEYVDWVQGSDCIRVRSNSEIDSGYLNYLFDSTYFGSYVMLYAVGATMPSMSSDILLNARILVPPVQEQKEIAAYLDKQCGKIDAIITNKQEQCATIRGHKKSLIYEYVTGKKRVTEVN